MRELSDHITLTFIGSGNLATHLATAFSSTGCIVSEVCSRDLSHAEKLAGMVGARAVASPAQLSPDADVCIVAVSDDALPQVAGSLPLHDSILLHTSGATPMSVLQTVSKRHGVLWSPQSFVRDITVDYRKTPFCIEGSDDETCRYIEALVRLISPQVYRLDGRQRLWAHLTAVLANNFGNALLAEAQQVAQEAGIPFDMFMPIIETTFRKASKGDLRRQQTGPAVRHDEATLQRHRELLAEKPELLELYNLFTSIIQQHAL